MKLYQKRIKEAEQFFESDDTFLGYRKLLDCAMDTQNMLIYGEAIELTDWKEKNPEQTAVFVTKAKDL